MNTLEQRVRQRCQRDHMGRLVYFPVLSRHGYMLQTDADFDALVAAVRAGHMIKLMVFGVVLAGVMALFNRVSIPMVHAWMHVLKPVAAGVITLIAYIGVQTMMLRAYPKSDMRFIRPDPLDKMVMAARNTHIAVPVMLWGFFFGMIWVTVVQWGDPMGVRVSNAVILAILFCLAAYRTYLVGMAAGLKAASPRD